MTSRESMSKDVLGVSSVRNVSENANKNNKNNNLQQVIHTYSELEDSIYTVKK